MDILRLLPDEMVWSGINLRTNEFPAPHFFDSVDSSDLNAVEAFAERVRNHGLAVSRSTVLFAESDAPGHCPLCRSMS